MAENKKSFLLYVDLLHTVKKMPDDKAGLLFKHILEYVNDLNPETDDLIVDLTFEPIKQQLKRDLQKWENHLLDKSNSGKLGNLKRWHNDLYLQVSNNELSIEDAIIIANNRKISHSDNVQSQHVAEIAVNVTDNVIVIDNEINNISTNVDMSTQILIDYEKLKNYWNDTFKGSLIPQIKILSEERKKKIKSLVNQFGKEEFIKAINEINQSDFCKGLQTNWHANFDFLLQKNSFIKLLEGSYRNNNQQKPQQQENNNTTLPKSKLYEQR